MDIWLLGLLGAGLLGALLLSDDDDGDDGADNYSGEKIDWEGEKELEGTDLDDRLTALAGSGGSDYYKIDRVDLKGGNDAATIEVNTAEIDMGDGNDTLSFGTRELYPSFGKIDLGDGDDVAIIDGGFGHSVNGGAGNDRIDVFGQTRVYGDSGNDTITGMLIGSADGGDGDDLLNIVAQPGRGEEAYMFGGNGNDTLQTTVMIGDAIDHYMPNWVDMTGGAGQDSFEIALKVGEMTHAEYDELLAENGVVREEWLPTIRDFNPAEDSITIEIDTTGTTVDRDVTITRHAQARQPDGSYRTKIEFQVPEAGGMVEGTAVLTIHSAVAFDLSVLNITVDGSPMAMPKAA